MQQELLKLLMACQSYGQYTFDSFLRHLVLSSAWDLFPYFFVVFKINIPLKSNN